MQELLDLKFIFYVGEPVRDVLRVSEPWGPTQHRVPYKDLVANKSFAEPLSFELLPTTKSAKIKTRITGHGMEFSSNWQHQCCEFYRNTHRLYSPPIESSSNLFAS
jgi:hypothetical protein